VGVEVYLHSFVTSALDGGEWSASCPGCSTPLSITLHCPAHPKKKREINHTSTDQEAGWVVANGINNGQNNEIKIKLYTK